MLKKNNKTLLWITIFSIAMGMLESAVVVYLRELYYPDGFSFPLTFMSTTVAITELLREAATLIMLVAIGVLAGRNNSERFAYFIYSFAIWDIFYYIFLKAILNWPESFLTWDILFLLPTTWVGPVLCPILLSIAMIILALFIIQKTHRKINPKLNKSEWTLLISGSVICIVSFTLEYSQYILQTFSFGEMFILNETLMNYSIKFIPEHFPWWIFISGFSIIIIGIIKYSKKENPAQRPGNFNL